ncbi:transposase [Methylorubrum extorquens]|nr:transposase [Methylorubrum extorquens]
MSGRIRRWATGRPCLSASWIWPTGYPWPLPCSSLATGPVQNTGQVTRFRGYVERALGPVLKRGDTVGLDNLPTDKANGICERIEAGGVRLLYLPVYLPDFNPIEQAFAKLKAILGAKAARTVGILWSTIRQALVGFTSAECRRYHADAGYDANDPT